MLGCIPSDVLAKQYWPSPPAYWQLRHDDYRAGAGLVSNLHHTGRAAFCGIRLLFRRTGHTANGFIPRTFPTDIRASAVGVIMSLSRIGNHCLHPALPILLPLRY